MGSNDALSGRQMLEKIKDQLERQEKTAWHRFNLSIATTFIVVSLSVLLASLSLGKTMELRWLILMLLLGGVLLWYWSWFEYTQKPRKGFAIAGTVLLIVGCSIWLKLFDPLPCITSAVRIVAGYLIFLLMLSGVILILVPRLVKKK